MKYCEGLAMHFDDLILTRDLPVLYSFSIVSSASGIALQDIRK